MTVRGPLIFGAHGGPRAHDMTFTATAVRLLLVVALALSMVAVGQQPAEAASKAQVVKVQQHLRRLGFDIVVDGVVGPRTRQAVCGARRLLRYGTPRRNGVFGHDLRSLRRAQGLPRPNKGSTYLWVDRRCQMMYQARNNRWVGLYKISTGTRGHATPGGRYRITWRWPGWHNSSQYPSDSGNGNMYNSMYFRSGGYAIHGSRSVPWYPASHGCVRVSVSDARRLFRSVAVGTRVIIFGRW